jgi:hypothetical protein
MAGFKYDDPSTPYDPAASGQVGSASAPTVAPPPVAPPGRVQTAAGYTPDYSGLITSDPSYLAAQSAAQLAQSNASAQRRAALRQAIIRYGGGLPAGFTDQYGDVDQATLDQAGQNQQSTLANLATNYAQSEEQFKRGLAARGALQSGDLNYGEDQLNRGYAQQRYDAANALGDTETGLLNSYSGVLNQNAQNLAGAVGTAEQNVFANPAYRPSAASYANYDAANSAKYGQAIYGDDSGNLYDGNGNPFSPPSAPPTPYAAPTDTSQQYFNPTSGQTVDYRPYVAPGQTWLT